MRRAIATAGVIAVAGALVTVPAGCTLLIAFDDVPSSDADASPPDASVEQRATGDTGPEPPPPDADADAGDASPPPPIAPPCDATFPLSEVKGCAGFVEGAQVCADNAALTSYPGDRTRDLVTCSKEGATCVRHCVACAHLPNGFPDQCDQCIGKADGDYCGTDMGWQPQHFKLLVTCTNERVAKAAPCAAGCDSKGGTGEAQCR